MDDVENGIRYRLPLKTTNWQDAKKQEKETLSDIAAGKLGAKAGLPYRPSTGRRTRTFRKECCTQQRKRDSLTRKEVVPCGNSSLILGSSEPQRKRSLITS
jgi:hypothetical protein